MPLPGLTLTGILLGDIEVTRGMVVQYINRFCGEQFRRSRRSKQALSYFVAMPAWRWPASTRTRVLWDTYENGAWHPAKSNDRFMKRKAEQLSCLLEMPA